mmetsp:Transcript_139509/g.446380  ORF Transcript_139509/g.446380 Transcript_139509/m.446380 type:complete len:101 (+) Transcript_139509:352-654(+)
MPADKDTFCRMQGGNTALILAKPPRPERATKGQARSRSAGALAGADAAAAAGGQQWRSRDTFISFQSWHNGAPTSLAAPLKHSRRPSQGTLRPTGAGRLS